jgi:hypothetical protein
MQITGNAELLDTVLTRMENGEVLTAICRDLGTTPSTISHIADRGQAGVEFSQRYARARELQAHAVAADVVRISDEEPDPQRARVRADARKWYAARLDPKTYGDKMQHEHRQESDPVAVDYDRLMAIAKTPPLTIEHEPSVAATPDCLSGTKR